MDIYEVVFAGYSDDPKHNYDIISSEDNAEVIETGFETEEQANKRIQELNKMDKIIEALEKQIEEVKGDISIGIYDNYGTIEDIAELNGEVKGLKQAIQIIKDKL